LQDIKELYVKKEIFYDATTSSKLIIPLMIKQDDVNVNLIERNPDFVLNYMKNKDSTDCLILMDIGNMNILALLCQRPEQ
jgi:hypothetical protein